MTISGDSGGLIERTRGGDRPAMEELLVRHLPGLRAWIRLNAGPIIRAHESGSDLAQSVCREVLQDLSRFEYQGEASFRHWLYTTALRKIQDRARHWARDCRDAGREAPPFSGDDSGQLDPRLAAVYASVGSPSAQAMAREEMERVEQMFDRLPKNYRAIITMSLVAGLSHKDIAELLGFSESYCRTLLARALARLARLVRTY